MLEIFGKFSFVIIASYASSITLLSALVIETLISKVKTDRELKNKDTENGSKNQLLWALALPLLEWLLALRE